VKNTRVCHSASPDTDRRLVFTTIQARQAPKFLACIP